MEPLWLRTIPEMSVECMFTRRAPASRVGWSEGKEPGLLASALAAEYGGTSPPQLAASALVSKNVCQAPLRSQRIPSHLRLFSLNTWSRSLLHQCKSSCPRVLAAHRTTMLPCPAAPNPSLSPQLPTTLHPKPSNP